MKTTDATYRALRSLEGSWYETQVVRGSVVYGDNVLTPYEKKIEKLSINPALFDDGGPQIGIARACVCRLEVYEAKENWPRMASFSVRMRIHSADDTQVSGWVPMGVFFTDRRKPDVFGKLSVTAYDGMLLLEQSWTDKVAALPSQWPITAAAAAALLEEATGIELENPAILDDSVAFVGLDTKSTARAVWSDIAAAHGCNLQMTAAGKLRLVPFASLGAYTGAVADIAVAGYAVTDSTGADSRPGDFFPLGLAVSTLDTGDDLPAVTGVELTTESGTVAPAGNCNGYVLKGVCNFSNSAAAQLCLARAGGKIYRPFDASTAHIDPSADPGDLVSVNGRMYQLMSLDWTICAKPTADIGAAFEEEIDHEYTVQSAGGKTLQIAVSAANAYSDAQLRDFLAGTYAADKANLQSQIDGKTETWYQSADPSTAWTTDELKAAHEGDLWYKTTDGTTWYWDGAAWQQQDVPDAVFDKIDGKAQIFTAQPTPPYAVGDLWFDSASSDIMTCVNARATGSYTASDWQKRNKYTDDTAADAVSSDLHTNYLTATQTRSAIQQSATSITQSVAAAYVSNDALIDALDDYSPAAQIAQRYYNKTQIDNKVEALASEIELTDSSLTLAFSQLQASTDDAINALTYYIRYENGVVIIGKTDSAVSIRISNSQIALYYGNTVVSYWNQTKQYTPTQLEIPTGGKFILGSILFQPRSSGNMSCMWVGS